MAFLIYPESGPPILYFDTIRNVRHMGEQTITDHPVEVGANITDHARKKNDELTFDGLVTMTPIQRDGIGGHGTPLNLILDVPKYERPLQFDLGSAFEVLTSIFRTPPQDPLVAQDVLQFTPFDPILTMQANLDQLIAEAILCTVTTFTKSYTSMLLARYEMPVERVGSAVFSLTFKEVRFASSSTVTAPVPKEPRGTPQAKAGAAGAGAPADARSAKEMANALVELNPGLRPILGPLL